MTDRPLTPQGFLNCPHGTLLMDEGEEGAVEGCLLMEVTIIS